MDLSSSGFSVVPDLSIGNVLGQSLATLKESPLFFFGLPLMAVLPAGIILYYKPLFFTSHKYLMLLGSMKIVLTLIGQGAVSYGVYQSLNGESVTAGASLRKGILRLPTMFFIAVLIVLISMGFLTVMFFGYWALGNLGAVAIAIYTILLSGFGLFLLTRLILAIQACVVEKTGALESLRRSTELTDGNRLKILALIFIMGIFHIIVSEAGTFIMAALFQKEGSALLVPSFLSVLSTGFNWVMVAVLYFQLRTLDEGVSLNKLTNVFE